MSLLEQPARGTIVTGKVRSYLMRFRRLLFVSMLCLLFIAPGNAQESIRLRFQITRNGSVVANPEMSINQGSVGRIDIKDSVSVAFTPRVLESRLTLTFDIENGDKHLQPQLAIDTIKPAAISWTNASGDSIRITVVAIR
jgi:hypothetical protein